MSRATAILKLAEKEYAYTISDVESIVKSVWGKIKKVVHKRFEQGYATCTYASLELGEALKKAGISFRVVSGEFGKGTGHWWLVVYAPKESGGPAQKWIVDLGNNLTKEALQTGKIKPVIKGFPVPGYKAESHMDFKDALKYLRMG